MSHPKRPTALIVSTLLLLVPLSASAHVYGTEKPHWAAPLVQSLQKDSLLKGLNTDSKTLTQPLSGASFATFNEELANKFQIEADTNAASTVKKLTREQAAVELHRLWKETLSESTASAEQMTFKDLSGKNASVQTAINWSVSHGIFKGYADRTFKPGQVMTVGEGVAVMNQMKRILTESQSESAAKSPSLQEAALLKELSWQWQPETDGTVSITVLWGEKPTGGYSLAIDSLTYGKGTLVAWVTLKSPKPEDFVTQALTYPKTTTKTTLKKADAAQTSVQIRLTPTTPASK